MADWRNKLDMITNKVKNQLFAKGVDNLEQLKGIFLVSRVTVGRSTKRFCCAMS